MWGWHHGWWWLVMTPVMVAFWVAAVWLVVSLVQDRAPQRDRTEEAERILAERYARGELEADEYRRRLEDIRR